MDKACARASALLVVWAIGVALAAAQPAERAPSIDLVPSSERAASGLAGFSADRAFGIVLDRMWEWSPTFRQQCRRFTLGASGVRLRLRLDHAPSTSVRARSTVEWRGGALEAVSMYVPAGPAMEELIAHELEHVLEQLDHVDLASHLASGVAWRQGSGEYESMRAIEAGRRVAAEIVSLRQRAGRR